MSEPETAGLLTLTAQIVAAHVGKNQVPAHGLTGLIHSVHAALAGVSDPAPAEPTRPDPAVPIKRSVFPDYIVCLEDGKKLKMLRRHLQSAYNMTPDDYRQRWGLPPDYPMVAPNYAERRSALARQIGLGRKDGGRAPVEEAPPEPVRAGRRRKAAADKG